MVKACVGVVHDRKLMRPRITNRFHTSRKNKAVTLLLVYLASGSYRRKLYFWTLGAERLHHEAKTRICET